MQRRQRISRGAIHRVRTGILIIDFIKSAAYIGVVLHSAGLLAMTVGQESVCRVCPHRKDSVVSERDESRLEELCRLTTKIDRSFIGSFATNSDQTAIVLAMISLAHTLRLRVVAEGVETAGQATFLREHGCDEGQGYLFSKPLAAGQFVPLLKARTLPNSSPIAV